MNFSIQGWMFHNHRACLGNQILDIGTTALVSNELENRIDGLIDHAAPLITNYGSVYKNPREWATAHARILKGFTTVKHHAKNYHFRIQKDSYNEYQLLGVIKDYSDINQDKTKHKEYFITLDGYNFDDVEVLFVPKDKHNLKLKKVTFDDFRKVHPKIGDSEPKPDTISGYPLEVTYRSSNTITAKLPNINYKGNFDIIVYDRIDYDTFYNAEGFYLTATK